MRSCIEEAWVWCFVFSCNQEIDLAVLPAHLLPIELRLWHSQLVQCNLGRAQTMIYKDILIYTFSRGWKRSSRKWIYTLFQRINFSVENFKKTRNLDGSSPEPRYSHVILVSGYPVIDSNMNVQHQVARSHSRNNVRTKRTYGHVTVWIDSQIVWVDGSARARLANAWSSALNWLTTRCLLIGWIRSSLIG